MSNLNFNQPALRNQALKLISHERMKARHSCAFCSQPAAWIEIVGSDDNPIEEIRYTCKQHATC